MKADLAPFLPIPRLKRDGGKWALDCERGQSIGRVDEVTAARKPVVRWRPPRS